MVFKGGENEVFSGLGKVCLDEEIGVESAKIKVVVLRCQTLFKQFVGFIVSIKVREHLGFANLGLYIQRLLVFLDVG